MLQRAVEDLQHLLPVHRESGELYRDFGTVAVVHVHQRRKTVEAFEIRVFQRASSVSPSLGAEVQRRSHDLGSGEPQEARRGRGDDLGQVSGVRGGRAMGGIDAAAQGHQERIWGNACLMLNVQF